MAIPHGDPEKVLQSHVLIFRTKDVFLGDNTMSNLSFLSNFTKRHSFYKTNDAINC